MLSNPEIELLAMLKNPSLQQKGFRLLVEKYQQRLYAHIRGIVGTHENTDDVLQNTFIRIFRGIEGFKGESSLYSWSYRIATNEAITFLKKHKKMPVNSLDDENMRIGSTLRAEQTFHSGEQVYTLLLNALDTLPLKQKQVFELKYFEELTYEEISERVGGTSVGALKASFHIASKKIEDFIKNIDL